MPPNEGSIEELLKQARTRSLAREQERKNKPADTNIKSTTAALPAQPQIKTLKKPAGRPSWMINQEQKFAGQETGLASQVQEFGPKKKWLRSSDSEVEGDREEEGVEAEPSAETENLTEEQEATTTKTPDIFAPEEERAESEKVTGGGEIETPTFDLPETQQQNPLSEETAETGATPTEGKEGGKEDKPTPVPEEEQAKEEKKTTDEEPVTSLARPKEETNQRETGGGGNEAAELKGKQNEARNKEKLGKQEEAAKPAEKEEKGGKDAGVKSDKKGSAKGAVSNLMGELGEAKKLLNKLFISKEKILWWIGSTIVGGLWSCGVWTFSLIVLLLITIPSAGLGSLFDALDWLPTRVLFNPYTIIASLPFIESYTSTMHPGYESDYATGGLTIDANAHPELIETRADGTTWTTLPDWYIGGGRTVQVTCIDGRCTYNPTAPYR